MYIGCTRRAGAEEPWHAKDSASLCWRWARPVQRASRLLPRPLELQAAAVSPDGVNGRLMRSLGVRRRKLSWTAGEPDSLVGSEQRSRDDATGPVASDLQPFPALAPEGESADCFGPLAASCACSAVYRYLAEPGSALPPRERARIPPEEAREEKAKEARSMGGVGKATWKRPATAPAQRRPASPSVARNGWTGGLRTNCLIAGVPARVPSASDCPSPSILALHCIAMQHEAEMLADETTSWISGTAGVRIFCPDSGRSRSRLFSYKVSKSDERFS
jgi:hypothetical protein